MKELTNPSKLSSGDLISVVSPSAGLGALFPHRVHNGRRSLEKLGFRVRFEQHALGRLGWVSGSVQDRVADIHRAFADNDVRCVLCSIGGDHSNQLLKYLDFDMIAKNPKVFVGYSDISVLHYALYKKAGLRTFYGPCLISEFGEYPDVLEYTKQSFLRALQGTIGNIKISEEWTDQFLDWGDKKNHIRKRVMHRSYNYEWWRNGRAEGRLIGGCVPSINHLLGTQYWIDPSGALFFIDIPEGQPGKPIDIASMDSFLADLDNHGVFSDISGLIIGRPYQMTRGSIGQLKRMIMYYAEPYDYPILYNVNIGHCSPSLTIPMGAKAVIDSASNSFSISGRYTI